MRVIIVDHDAGSRARVRRLLESQDVESIVECSTLDEVGSSVAAAEHAPANRLLVRVDSRIVMIRTDDVAWIEAAGNYVRIHTDTQKYLIRESISRLESMLDPARFARIHRSTIINVDRIRELQPWFSGEMIVVMKDGTQLKLSRTYRRSFERAHRIYS